MLEVKNLRKVYKTKNGADVNALDGVSLQFPETGMVFLLGKSGSGKSTLLNVCGGLDFPTEGEIIVKGRSSKSFSQSDFDSYRNTFIGFIFQEYNILNEFTVEDNIALALELQGKPKDKAAIEALLDEVDLKGYAKRKPNTLSGGQKQRIAIARALVKAPEIIMADEPTGALDSNTGRQVFETLKKLSQHKLVIVVSHDRDFAEQYGDRIIELQDGKVISDVSKTALTQEALTDNIHVVGDVLCIKSGAQLGEGDFERIKAFLKRSEKDVIIASDEADVKNFKKVSRINDQGEKEVFRTTAPSDADKKTYTKEDSRFIRSRLPIRHAFKIGVSGLRNKPVRLFFTVVLCCVAFVLFGLLSTLNFYNSEATFKQTLTDANVSALQLNKEYEASMTWYSYGEKEHDYTTYFRAQFAPGELKELAGQFNADAFGAVEYDGSFSIRQSDSAYWVNSIRAVGVLPEGNSLRSSINGAYPKTADEIVISSYFAELLQTCKAYDANGIALELNAPADILGRAVMINGTKYTVTGILDTGAIPDEYALLKEAGKNDDPLFNQYYSHLQSGLHLLVFVTDERLELLGQERGYYMEGIRNYTHIGVTLKQNGQFKIPEWSNTRYLRVSELPDGQKWFSLAGGDKLADDQAQISSALLASLVAQAANELGNEASNQENYTLADSYFAMSNLAYEVEMGGYYNRDKDTEKDVFVTYTDAQLDQKIEELIAAVKKAKLDLTLGVQLFDSYNEAYIGDVTALNIASVFRSRRSNEGEYVYLTDAAFTRLWDAQKVITPNYEDVQSAYRDDPEALYTTVYLPGNVSTEKLDTYWDIYNNKEFEADGSRIYLTGGLVDDLKFVDSMVQDLSQIFLYIGLVLAVFAALLLSNFISVSISHKKREIGILRAVGARSADVFKIFFSESFVIAAICVVLSIAASIVVCNFINKELANELGASLFVFGVASIAVLIGIALITVVVATFLPVYNAAKKKPVDSIRSI